MKQGNKKWIISSIILLLVIGISTFAFISNKNSNTDETPEKIEENESEVYNGTQSYTSMDSLDNEKLKNLSGLKYELLSANKIVQDGTNNFKINANILLTEPLSMTEFTKLHDAMIVESKKQLNEDDVISSLSINLFNSKDSYELTTDESYNDIYVEGLLQMISSSITENGTSYQLFNYLTYSPKTNVEDVVANEDFEFVNAYSFNDGKQIHGDVIIPTASPENIADMFQALLSMVQVSNEGAESVNLTAYLSKDNMENNEFSYQYNVNWPNMIIYKEYHSIK